MLAAAAARLGQLAGQLVWWVFIVIRWAHANFVARPCDFFLDSVLGSWEEAVRVSVRESFAWMARAINGLSAQAVSLFVDPNYYDSMRAGRRRPTAWQASCGLLAALPPPCALRQRASAAGLGGRHTLPCLPLPAALVGGAGAPWHIQRRGGEGWAGGAQPRVALAHPFPWTAHLDPSRCAPAATVNTAAATPCHRPAIPAVAWACSLPGFPCEYKASHVFALQARWRGSLALPSAFSMSSSSGRRRSCWQRSAFMQQVASWRCLAADAAGWASCAGPLESGGRQAAAATATATRSWAPLLGCRLHACAAAAASCLTAPQVMMHYWVAPGSVPLNGSKHSLEARAFWCFVARLAEWLHRFSGCRVCHGGGHAAAGAAGGGPHCAGACGDDCFRCGAHQRASAPPAA